MHHPHHYHHWSSYIKIIFDPPFDSLDRSPAWPDLLKVWNNVISPGWWWWWLFDQDEPLHFNLHSSSSLCNEATHILVVHVEHLDDDDDNYQTYRHHCHHHHYHDLFPIDADQKISLLESCSLSIGEHPDLAELYALNLPMVMLMMMVMTMVTMMTMVVMRTMMMIGKNS